MGLSWLLVHHNIQYYIITTRLRCAAGELSATGDWRVKVSRCPHQESGGKVRSFVLITDIAYSIYQAEEDRVSKYQKYF